MNNSVVEFRRGTKADLPDEITDGFFSINVDDGKIYLDITDGAESKRISIGGNLYARLASQQDYTFRKSAVVPGIHEYYDGMTVTVVFDNAGAGSDENVMVSFNTLEYVPLYSGSLDTVTCKEITAGVPYTITYREFEGMEDGFVVSSSGASRPKWKRLSD